MARKRDVASAEDQANGQGEESLAEAGQDRHRDAVMQRIRVGVTGLAAVFLLTLLAASIFNLLGQDEHGTTRLANGQTVASNSAAAIAEDPPKEPLAELGVAPGGATKPPAVAAPTTPAPTPRVAPAAVPGKPVALQAAPVTATPRPPQG